MSPGPAQSGPSLLGTGLGLLLKAQLLVSHKHIQNTRLIMFPTHTGTHVSFQNSICYPMSTVTAFSSPAKYMPISSTLFSSTQRGGLRPGHPGLPVSCLGRWPCPQADRAVESEATGLEMDSVTTGLVPYFAKLDLSTPTVLRIDSILVSLLELFKESP